MCFGGTDLCKREHAPAGDCAYDAWSEEWKVNMAAKRLFDEIRVYEGTAERTGVQFDRDAVRGSARQCKCLTELIRRARDAGDGYFYLPLGAWPPDTERVELQKQWTVISTSMHAPGLDKPDVH